MKNKEILELKTGTGISIKVYLRDLLSTLWAEKECFNSKRPFGDSGWQFDLYYPLIKAGLVEGCFDDDEYIDELDMSAADAIILKLINEIFETRWGR